MIQIQNLNKYFNFKKKNQVHALKDINLNISKNELVILKGISGSGKSTLLSIIAGLLKPSDGSIIVNKEAIAKLPDRYISDFRLKNIGFIFQAFNLFDQFTVEQNLQASLIPLNNSLSQDKKTILSTLTQLNIIDKQDEIVSNLSGGEKQRVAIARALVNNPDIILCDEPTSSLDEQNSLIFCDILKTLKEQNKTIIVATHDPLFETLDFVDKIITMKNGKCTLE